MRVTVYKDYALCGSWTHVEEPITGAERFSPHTDHSALSYLSHDMGSEVEPLNKSLAFLISFCTCSKGKGERVTLSPFSQNVIFGTSRDVL